MKDLELDSWTTFKNTCLVTKGLNCQYSETSDRYDMYGPDLGIMWHTSILKSSPASSDQSDFENNYKPTANGRIDPAQLDNDGASLSRVKVAPTGWNFNYRMIEIQLSTIGGLYNCDMNGADVGDAVMRLYDTNGALITDSGLQGNAVKTIVDLEPPYNICVAGGCLRMSTSPTEDVWLNVVAVPDVPAIYNGSKVFIQNVNLSYIDGTIGLNADGRAAKMLNYSATMHTNKFRFQFTHPAGYQFWCALLMEIYKQ